MGAVAIAIVEGLAVIITRIAPWIGAWLLLTDNGKQSPQKGAEQWSTAITKGPTSVVFQYWLVAGLFTVAAGAGIWYWQSKVAEGRGETMALPPPQPIALPHPPSFGSSGGIGVSAGPIHVTQGVSAGGQGAPPVNIYEGGGGGGGSRGFKTTSTPHRTIPSKTERRTTKARANAGLYSAQASELAARNQLAHAKSSGFHS